MAELSQIKAQVDHLLDSLELLDQQKDQLPGLALVTLSAGSFFPLLKVPRTPEVPPWASLVCRAPPRPPQSARPPTPSACFCGLRTLVASRLSCDPHLLSSCLEPEQGPSPSLSCPLEPLTS